MLVLHACGGIASGLGLLLLVPVGALALLLPPRSALFLAAVAVIALLADTIWQQLSGHADITSYATAGLLGVVLFTAAPGTPQADALSLLASLDVTPVEQVPGR